MAAKSILTAARLREVLSYNPKTGKFRWLEKGPGRSRIVGGAHIQGYIRMSVDYRSYLAHRLAWLWMSGNFPDGWVDHINGNKTDNRWANLRLVTPTQNHANRTMMRTNTTGFIGVYKGKNKRWLATFREKHLGMFDTPEKAHEAYRQAALTAYGEFAHHSLRMAAPQPRKDLLSSAELPLTPQKAFQPGTTAAKHSHPEPVAAEARPKTLRNRLHSPSTGTGCIQDRRLSEAEKACTNNQVSSAAPETESERDKSSR